MKRIYIGIGLLIVLLVLGIWIASAADKAHAPGAVDLEHASQLVLEGSWDKAEALAKRARETWQKKWCFTASVSDHEPMDEIDALFARLSVYARTQDAKDYAAVCAELSERLEAMSQAHAFSWWNLM